MNNKKLIFYIFFLLVQKEYASNFLYDQDSIFFNILYIASKRSEATIRYFTYFIECEDCMSKFHKQILCKMRNPSKCSQFDYCVEYEKKQIEYIDVAKETINIYNAYSFIVNNYTDLLTNERKEVLEKQKQDIANNLLKELLSLENITLLIQNFFNNLEQLDAQKRYGIMSIKNMLSDLSDKISLYFYYQKMYVAFDKLLINQYDYFIQLKYLFNSYYKQFWITIEKKRLEEIIKTYNFYMNIYREINNTKIKKMVFNTDTKEIFLEDDELPDMLHNSFL